MSAQDNGVQAADKPSGYTAGSDSFTRWRNWFSLLTGQMNGKDVEQYRIDRDHRMEEADCKRCESNRDYLLQYSGFADRKLTTRGSD